MSNLENSFRVAAIQMVSSTHVDDNLKQAADLIAQAAADHAKLIVLPEYFCFMGRHDAQKLDIQEAPGQGLVQEFLSEQAHQHGVWLVGGTLPLSSPESNRVYNSCLVYDPQGKVVARYDKIHLFGFSRGDESYDESLAILPGGNPPQSFMAPWGRTGLSVCYDLRFPELFRAMGELKLIVMPAAFTYTTGQAHWDILLRARAIENQCYVLAAAQGGKHENGRRTWGHSVLIDPWGEIIASVAQGTGLAAGTIDLQHVANIRLSLPALKHRKM